MDHIEHLIKKHRELDNEIWQLEQIKPAQRAANHDTLVSALKKKKLALKDKISVDSTAKTTVTKTKTKLAANKGH